ncbi:MAG: DNA repair exonuclease [Candidatus Velthaea sp.]
MLTLVHAADVHLETTFPDVRGGNRRRAALADAFVRIVDLALERHADALTIGGDLFEAERAGPQTARFVFEQFARFGKPVFVAPGNHDPYAARSLYARDDLPANVRVFGEAAWIAFPLAEGVTLYGFGHTPAEPGRPFAHARFDRPGVRLALVHGSDEDRCPPGKRATAPYTAGEITAAGATLALSGHYHGGYIVHDAAGRPVLAYPGSPEPIKFGERGRHGALVVRVQGERVEIEPLEIARTRLIDLDVRLDGASSEHAVTRALEEALAPHGGDDFVRVRLQGAIERGTRIDCDMLAERCGTALGGLDILDRTIAANYAELAREPNVRGHALGDLLQRAKDGDADAERALALVVAAFEGAEIAP